MLRRKWIDVQITFNWDSVSEANEGVVIARNIRQPSAETKTVVVNHADTKVGFSSRINAGEREVNEFRVNVDIVLILHDVGVLGDEVAE